MGSRVRRIAAVYATGQGTTGESAEFIGKARNREYLTA